MSRGGGDDRTIGPLAIKGVVWRVESRAVAARRPQSAKLIITWDRCPPRGSRRLVAITAGYSCLAWSFDRYADSWRVVCGAPREATGRRPA